MNIFDRSMRAAFLQLLQGEKPTRVVWTADLTYWMEGQRRLGRGAPEWNTPAGYLQLHRDAGVMPYYDYTHFWAGTPALDPVVSETVEQQGPLSTHRLRTPLGEMFEEHIDLPESACIGCRRHFVHTEKDLDNLLFVLEHRHLAPSANQNDYFARFEAWSHYDGVPCMALPRSPLTAFVYEWAGVENAIYLLSDHEDKVRQIMTLLEAQEQPVIAAVCRLRPPLVHFPDNMDSENFTSLYDEFMAPAHRRRIEQLHAAGVRVAVHLDGAVRGLLPKLAAVGFDAIEAITPKPAGDVDVSELRGLAGNDRVILWGGVPGAMFAPPFTWADMQCHVERVLALWEGQRFILGVADQVPANGDLSFCKKIADMLG